MSSVRCLGDWPVFVGAKSLGLYVDVDLFIVLLNSLLGLQFESR